MSIHKYFLSFLVLLLLDIFLFFNFYFAYFSSHWNFCDDVIIVLTVLINILLVNCLLCKLVGGIADNRRKIENMKKEFNIETNKYLEEVADLNRMVEAGKISLAVYHDLANILTASNLALHEIFVKSKDNLDINELTRKIFSINKQANDLIKSFKRQCSHEDCKIKFCFKKEIERVLSVFNFYFIKYNIIVNIDCDNGIKFFGVSVKFGQILSNLVSNSIESLSKVDGEKKISIKVLKIDNGIKIFFSDSGLGIDPDVLDKVFKPFFSLSDNNENRHCGIGLAIVKKIVEKDFSGQVSIDSHLGCGTNFIITLSA